MLLNMKYQPKEEESNSTMEEESKDEESETPGVRRSVREGMQRERYSPSTFCSNFCLSITDNDPITIKEVVGS